MIVFFKEKKPPMKTSHYTENIAALIKERNAIESVLPFLEDGDYLTQTERVDIINKELGGLYKKAKEEKERNEDIYAFATVARNSEKISS